MDLPRFLRIDRMEPSVITQEEIRPIVHKAMERFVEISPEASDPGALNANQLTENSLSEYNIVIINGDYLFAYVIGNEWFSNAPVLSEVYLMRIGKGDTSLSEVFDVIRSLTKLAGAREAQLCPGGRPALNRLYRINGAEEVASIMRIV